MKAALRSAVMTWLGLIALQAFSSQAATGRVAGLFGDLNSVVNRVLDANTAAIPDRRPNAPENTPPSPLLDPNARPLYFTRIPVPNA